MNALQEKKKTNANTNIGFLPTLIIIFVSNDTLLFGTNSIRYFFWIHVGILLILFIYLTWNTKRISSNVLCFLLLLTTMMILTFVVNQDNEVIKYLYNAFVILLCGLFCKKVKFQDFFKAYVNIVSYIALFAIILFMLWMVAAPVVRLFPSITNESGIRYYFAGLGFVEELNFGVLPRMYGIFREPGVFTCYLILALIMELYFTEQLNIRAVLIISLAAILTFSTAAYILVSILLVGYFTKQLFGSSHKNKKVFRLLIALVILIMTVFLLIGPEKIFGIVFNKLKVENSSRDSRFGSISANVQIFLESPMLGKGWEYVEDKFVYFASLGTYRGAHNTNTFLKILAIYGVAFFICMIVTTYIFFKKESRSIYWGIFLTIMWIVTLSNEDMSVNILFYLFPFYALENNRKNERIICENISD